MEEPKIPIEKEIPTQLEVKIVLSNEGKITVYGPIENEPLMFWLFEKAKDIVKGSNIKKAMEKNPKVIQNSHGIMNFIRGGFK